MELTEKLKCVCVCYCTSSAHEAIKGYSILSSSEGYEVATETLQELYSTPHSATRRPIRELTSDPELAQKGRFRNCYVRSRQF